MMQKRRVLGFIDRVSELAGKLGSFLLIAITVIIAYEVVSRYVFNAPTLFATELSSYILVPLIALVGPWVLLKEEHVSVDIMYRHFSPRTKAICRLISAVMFLIFFGVTLWKGVDWTWSAFVIKKHSHTTFGPILWPIMMFLPIGALMMLVQRAAIFIRQFDFVLRGYKQE